MAFILDLFLTNGKLEQADQFIFYYENNILMKKTVSAKSTAPFKAQDYANHGLSLEEVQQIKQAFDLFDVQATGLIDPQELKKAMTTLGFQSKNATLFEAVNHQATSGGSAFNFEKFLDLMTARASQKDNRQNVKRVFALFDDEKSGFISIKNLRRVVKEVGQNIDEGELQEMIDRADLDNDGLISEEEFYAIMTKRTVKA